jgi:hypothetical protein
VFTAIEGSSNVILEQQDYYSEFMQLIAQEDFIMIISDFLGDVGVCYRALVRYQQSMLASSWH